MKKTNTLILCLLFLHQIAIGQRYLREIFDQVTITDDVTYGVNATVLFLGIEGQAIPEELKATIYEPTGDTEIERPVAILIHSGFFLPPTLNGGCSGTREDAGIISMANSLAKRGYVVMAIDYRLGWNPVAADQVERTFTLINGIYRGIQDARTAIRFLRKTVQEDGNPFKINSDKIALIGFEAGGYITSSGATLDKVQDTWVSRFIINNTMPMIRESINGDVNATTVGIAPINYPGFPAGDTLCYPNHVGYSSDFNLAVNLSGAMIDTSLIDEDDVPLISFHVPSALFSDCHIGVYLPNILTNNLLFEFMGSCAFQPIINRKDVNEVFFSVNWLDDITAAVTAKNGNLEGFVPFPSSDISETGPWNFSNSLEPYGVIDSNCDTAFSESQPYLDTIYQYLLPRACLALDLNCDLRGIAARIGVRTTLQGASIGLTMTPNPAYDQVAFITESAPIKQIALYDLSGKLLMQQSNVNTYNYTLLRRNMMAGMYIAQLQFDEGIISKKIVFN